MNTATVELDNEVQTSLNKTDQHEQLLREQAEIGLKEYEANPDGINTWDKVKEELTTWCNSTKKSL